MPKELLEVKQFTAGTISVPSETDVPDDAAVLSQNIDPSSEDGKLKGIPQDKDLALEQGTVYLFNADAVSQEDNNKFQDDITTSVNPSGAYTVNLTSISASAGVALGQVVTYASGDVHTYKDNTFVKQITAGINGETSGGVTSLNLSQVVLSGGSGTAHNAKFSSYYFMTPIEEETLNWNQSIGEDSSWNCVSVVSSDDDSLTRTIQINAVNNFQVVTGNIVANLKISENTYNNLANSSITLEGWTGGTDSGSALTKSYTKSISINKIIASNNEDYYFPVESDESFLPTFLRLVINLKEPTSAELKINNITFEAATNNISSDNIFTVEDENGEFIIYNDKVTGNLSSLTKDLDSNTYIRNNKEGFGQDGIVFNFSNFYASKDRRITTIGIDKQNSPKWLGKIEREQFNESLSGYYLEDLELKSPSFNSFGTSLDQVIEQKPSSGAIGYVYGIKRGGDKLYRIQYEVDNDTATTNYETTAASTNTLNGKIIASSSLDMKIGCFCEMSNGVFLLYDEQNNQIHKLDVSSVGTTEADWTAVSTANLTVTGLVLNNSELLNTDRLEVGDIKYTGSALILLYTPRNYDNVEYNWAKAVTVFDDQGKKDARFLVKSTTSLATSNATLTFTDITPTYFMCSHGENSSDVPTLRSWDYWYAAYSERLKFRHVDGSGNIVIEGPFSAHCADHSDEDSFYILEDEWGGFEWKEGGQVYFAAPRYSLVHIENEMIGVLGSFKNLDDNKTPKIYKSITWKQHYRYILTDEWSMGSITENLNHGLFTVNSSSHTGVASIGTTGRYTSYRMNDDSNSNDSQFQKITTDISSLSSVVNIGSTMFITSSDGVLNLLKFYIPEQNNAAVTSSKGTTTVFDGDALISNAWSHSDGSSHLLSIHGKEGIITSSYKVLTMVDDHVDAATAESVVIYSGETGISFTEVAEGNFGTGLLNYKMSYTYDSYQESPLSKSTWSHDVSAADKNIQLDITIPKETALSKRVTDVSIYRAFGNGSYALVKTIPLNKGWNLDNEDNPTIFTYTFVDNNNSIGDYEDINGISETLDRTILYYSKSTMVNSMLAVMDAYSPELDESFQNYIFFSKPNSTSQFDYTKDYVILPNKPTAIAGFSGRIFAFDNNNMYRIDPNSLIIEDIFEGIGCIGQKALCVTDYGMCFASKNNVYLHDGAKATPIATPILKSSHKPEWSHSYQKAIKTSLNNGFEPSISFDSKTSSFLIFIIDWIDFANIGKVGKVWAYNLARQRWDRWQSPVNISSVTLEDGSIIISDENKLTHYMGDPVSERDWEWVSKEFTMGQDTQEKRISRLRLTGDIVPNQASTSGTIVRTGDNPDGVELWIDGAQVALTRKDDYQYKPTSVKKGKTFQLKLVNQTSDKYVDSFGIIFRRRPVK